MNKDITLWIRGFGKSSIAKNLQFLLATIPDFEQVELPWWHGHDKVYVVPHTRVQFDKFKWDNYEQYARNPFVQVYDRDNLMGLRSGLIVLLDGWVFHPRAKNIREMLWSRIHIGRYVVRDAKVYPHPDIAQIIEIVE